MKIVYIVQADCGERNLVNIVAFDSQSLGETYVSMANEVLHKLYEADAKNEMGEYDEEVKKWEKELLKFDPPRIYGGEEIAGIYSFILSELQNKG